MKHAQYCTYCHKKLGSFFKRYVFEKTPVEKGPFFICTNKECREYIPAPLDKTIERPLNSPFVWIRRVAVENVFDQE